MLTSNHPIIGSWVDGHVNLTSSSDTFDYDVTEFDNIITDVPFGTYVYTFNQPGTCYDPIIDTLVVDCDAIDFQSGNVLLNIYDDESAMVPVFVLTSNHPIIGSWVDGHINLTDGTNTYDYDVTEFDNIISDVALGTYNYTFTQAGGCYAPITGTLVVDCDAIDPQSGNVLLTVLDEGPNITSAPVFVLTSNHPIIGSWVDGHVNLTSSSDTFDYDVTEFDNIIADVPFGTYVYTFNQPGTCYDPIIDTLVVDCDAIDFQSGNVLLNIYDDESAMVPVFVLTSNHPIIGSWVDGHINLTDGTNTYDYDVTEFDNIISDVALGTYNYTFTQAGGCYAPITGTLVVDCDAIDPQSGNVLLTVLDEGPDITAASVFVLTSNHPIIGSWVDGHVNLTSSSDTFDYDVTEFDNIIADVPFGTYIYTFNQSGNCYPPISDTLMVDCDAISPQSGNVLLMIVDQGEEVVTDTMVTISDNVLMANDTNATYQWIDCATNMPIPGETNREFTATITGSYAVILTNVCDESVMSACYNVIVVGVEVEKYDLDLMSYPNPVVDAFNIQLDELYENINIQLYSIDGKLRKTFVFENQHAVVIDVSEFSTGTYVVKVNSNEKVGVIKINKQAN